MQMLINRQIQLIIFVIVAFFESVNKIENSIIILKIVNKLINLVT